jgi:hypothetical protein
VTGLWPISVWIALCPIPTDLLRQSPDSALDNRSDIEYNDY